jgi:protein gp37
MGSGTGIEWTEVTWNPTTGCDRISAGCDHCYALALARRLKAMGQAKYQADGDPRTSGPGFGLTVHPDALRLPYTWGGHRTVFVNSMSDLFHVRVPLSFVRDVFDVIAATPQHTYQVLTKRSARLPKIADRLDWPSNLWLGVSVEDASALLRVDHLRAVPAAVRFLSCEPLIGPLAGLDLTGIDWVIAGGESGPDHRPLDQSWVTAIRDSCLSASVPFFFKLLCTISFEVNGSHQPVSTTPGSGGTSAAPENHGMPAEPGKVVGKVVEIAQLDSGDELTAQRQLIRRVDDGDQVRMSDHRVFLQVSYLHARAAVADGSNTPRQRPIPRIHRTSAIAPAAVISNTQNRAVYFPSEMTNRSRRAISTTARSFHCIGTPSRCTQRHLDASRSFSNSAGRIAIPGLRSSHARNRPARDKRRVTQVVDGLAVARDVRAAFQIHVSGQTFDVDDLGFSRCTESGNSSDPSRTAAKAGIAGNCPAKSVHSVKAFA